MTIHQNDLLYPLALCGDYVRSGKVPTSEHPLFRRLKGLLNNQRIFDHCLEEAGRQLERLLTDYMTVQRNRSVWQPYNDHLNVLPTYCQLHSVLHGAIYWDRMNPDIFGNVTTAALDQYTRLNRQTLHAFGQYGLTFSAAEEILVFAGRELIDPELTCYMTLPLESDITASSRHPGHYQECCLKS